ncbi:hypothetical protein [Agromyces humi]|uniref:hypothetical protein n=1 Tax=Agromyces humi TaxID=1766800 RepID=UPI001358A9FF|nr:hypothetical protein [Agromyces humi]
MADLKPFDHMDDDEVRNLISDLAFARDIPVKIWAPGDIAGYLPGELDEDTLDELQREVLDEAARSLTEATEQDWETISHAASTVRARHGI